MPSSYEEVRNGLAQEIDQQHHALVDKILAAGVGTQEAHRLAQDALVELVGRLAEHWPYAVRMAAKRLSDLCAGSLRGG